MADLLTLLDQIDRQWVSGGQADIKAMLDALPPDQRAEVAVELCAADMEWQWRVGAEPPRSVTRMARIARARHYRPLLGELWDQQPCRWELLLAEWSIRSVWGDQPHIDEFAAEHCPDGERELAEHLHQIAPLHARVSMQGAPGVLQINLPSRFVAGRQRAAEPNPPAWLPATRKLVVGASAQRSLSRDQVQARRTKLHELEVRNLSAAICGNVNDWVLPPGAVKCARVPLTMLIGKCKIVVDCAEQPH